MKSDPACDARASPDPTATDSPAAASAGLTLWRGSLRDAARTYFSPMEVKQGPVWAHIGLLLLFNTGVALVMSLGALPVSLEAGWEIFRKIFPFAQFIGTSILVLHNLGEMVFGAERIAQWPLPIQPLYRAALACLGVFVGYIIGIDWRTGSLQHGLDALADEGFVASVGIALVATFIIYQIMSARTRAAVVQAEMERERTRSAASEAREAAARLQLLQAQIEPHFLFNTLANVVGMIEPRPKDARKMLEDFIYYLRASLNVTRGDQTRLGDELELMQRYLSIFQFRMGKRLAFSIDCPDALRSIPIAPMLLQPLVENAIEHGLEPKVLGGTVSVHVRKIGPELRIVVSDTGLGFHPGAHSGIGLANVRERLQLLYAGRAQLSIEDRESNGTTVSISILLGPDEPPSADRSLSERSATTPAGLGPGSGESDAAAAQPHTGPDRSAVRV